MSSDNTPSLDELDRYLFKCADIIRNTVDKTDYKDYILPLVFYKTISDTYQDNYEELLEEYDDPEIASDEAFHDFVVPEEYRWEELRKQSERVDEFINDAFSALERENEPTLDGVFRTDFRRADALGDTKLTDLVEHLSTYNLSTHRVPPDLLGEAYMDLVRHFADEEGRDGGEFFTPPHIVDLMVRLLAPYEDGAEIHDPTAGSGGMLVRASRYAMEDPDSGDPDGFRLTGQEVNPDIAAIARMNLFINGYSEDGHIRREDSLSNPQFTEDGQLEAFDYVLANFPFSADWDKDGLRDDKYGRFNWAEEGKLPRADRGDYAFIMHKIAQLNETGRAAIVIPHGVLFRRHESKFRKPMLSPDGGDIPGVDHEIVEAVVGLPSNLFQNNSIPSAILVLNKDKPVERQGQVLFFHAGDNYVDEFYRELSNQNELTERGLDHVVENFRSWNTEERVSRVVDVEEIAANDYSLNIALYVDTTEPQEEIHVAEELTMLHDLRAERDELEARMDQHMEVLGYE
ncbi:class I SAM-dependent DNA methyltransferase [Halobacterium salinarum]|uniref:type I restriction-modification system subunit M n=1 Tax=Halobacterium salinarum TaxID=2242 RepID=UPI002552F4FB|nr:class I SAM-dependent DNA methyltransferase [Halobacterium salinarum]MDL0130059.1 class I SAM-dependent DNA methyltransferase [Halobacterium salinarum]